MLLVKRVDNMHLRGCFFNTDHNTREVEVLYSLNALQSSLQIYSASSSAVEFSIGSSITSARERHNVYYESEFPRSHSRLPVQDEDYAMAAEKR